MSASLQVAAEERSHSLCFNPPLSVENGQKRYEKLDI